MISPNTNMNMERFLIVILVVITLVGIVIFITTFSEAEIQTHQETRNNLQNNFETKIILNESQQNEIGTSFPSDYSRNESQCGGNARCISGFITRVIDGDTIVVGDKSIRFALVNTPEWGDYDYAQAGNYIETICPVGSKVLIDEDDGQTQGSFGRIVGKIYCNKLNLNEEILEAGHAEILTKFCDVSEFAEESWAQKFGC